MATEILSGLGKAVMYCNTTNWAFGPVAVDDHDTHGIVAEDQLEGFIEMLPNDPRSYSQTDLEALWAQYSHDLTLTG